MKIRLVRALSLLVILVLVFPAPVLWAQAKPEKAPASKTQKAAKAAPAPAKAEAKAPLEGYDAFVEATMKDWKTPGVAIAIIKDDKVIYAKGFGQRNVKQGLPATPDTLFAIGSTTKAFTAAALGILVDESKVEWDKPVRQYMPAFRMQDDYVSEHMTPRDLVTHRSGLPRHDLLWYGSPFSRQELFDRLRYLEPSRGFRASYQYQNLMFMTAGILVEQVSHGPWEKFIQTHFLDPLEMKITNFSVTTSQKTSDFALPYGVRKDRVEEIPFRNIDAIGPAGCINSSAREMANWVILQLNKGKFKDKQVVSEKSLGETHTPQVVTSTTLRYDEVFYSMYGMGWGITSYRGHLMLSHGGGIDGFTALVSLMPKDKLGLIILTNLGGNRLPPILAYNAYDRLLGLSEVEWNKRAKDEVAKAKEAEEKARQSGDPNRKADTKPSHELKEYAGKYEHPGYGAMGIAESNDELWVSFNGLGSRLRHYHYDVFEGTNEQLDKQKFTFGLNAKGDVDRVSVALQDGVSDIVFTRMPEPMELSRAFLEKMTGEYELPGVTMKISLRGGKTLIASLPGQPDYELVPMKGLEFNFKGLRGFSIEFRMATGSVAEAIVTQPNGVFTAKKK